MILKYCLKENDYLQMHLFFFKDRGQLKKSIIKFHITICLIIGIIITILSISDNVFGAILISIALIIGPFLWTSSIKKHYFKQFLKESKVHGIGIENLLTLEITDNYININKNNKEIKIINYNCKRIIETTQHFFIKFNPEILIVPKSEINNLEFLKKELILLSKKQNIIIENHLKWKW